MFTGIIEKTAHLVTERRTEGSLWASCDTGWADVVEGESICVDGVCLTATETFRGKTVFYLSPETLSKTRFGVARVNFWRVNLERALQANARLSGHFVTGHIDGIGRIVSYSDGTLCVSLAEELARLCPPKGSVTLNGVSLTINRCIPVQDGQWWIEMQIIPHTAMTTNLSELKANEVVNLEADILAKTVEHLCKFQKLSTL